MNHINFYYLLIMLNIMLGTDGNYAKMVRSINRFIEKAQKDDADEMFCIWFVARIWLTQYKWGYWNLH